jgi:hypothetical protein
VRAFAAVNVALPRFGATALDVISSFEAPDATTWFLNLEELFADGGAVTADRLAEIFEQNSELFTGLDEIEVMDDRTMLLRLSFTDQSQLTEALRSIRVNVLDPPPKTSAVRVEINSPYDVRFADAILVGLPWDDLTRELYGGEDVRVEVVWRRETLTADARGQVFDLSEARELLAASGLEGTTIAYPSSNSPMLEAIVRYLAEMSLSPMEVTDQNAYQAVKASGGS